MKFIYLLLLSISSIGAWAQDFSKLENARGKHPMKTNNFKVYGRYTSVSSKINGTYGAPTINIGFNWDNYTRWGKRTRYENPTLGDFIQGIPRATKDIKNIVNDEQTSLTSNKWDDHAHGAGFVGWLQYYFNAVSKPRLLVSPGISTGDYIYSSRSRSTGSMETKDPAGYYLAVGPAIMASYLLSNNLWIDGYVNYDISVYRAGRPGNYYTETPGYKKPHFLSVGADVNTSGKLFGGVRLNQMLDKGPHNDSSSRLDISLGFAF